MTCANWRKYPNDLSEHVLSCDVLERSVDPQTGILKTERLLKCKQVAPSILKWLGFQVDEEAFFSEISYLDPKTQTYIATTYNMSLTNILAIKETLSYQACKTNANQTQLTQNCQAIALGGASVGQIVESAALKVFGANAVKGREGLELVVQKILQEAKELEKGIDGFFDKIDESDVKNVMRENIE